MEWVTNVKGTELANVSYAVFGCGNRDWFQTYQHIPKLIDSVMEEHGARRLIEAGAGDASEADFFEAFDDWERKLWETLSEDYKATLGEVPVDTSSLTLKTVDAGTHRAAVLRQSDAALGTVVENRLLTAPGVPQKRHIGELFLRPSSHHAKHNSLRAPRRYGCSCRRLSCSSAF